MFNKIHEIIKTKKESGYVLITALVVLAMGAILISPLVSLMVIGLNAGQVVEEKTDMLYAADAGVENAILIIKNLPDSVPEGKLNGLDDDDDGTDDYEFTLSSVNGSAVDVTIEYHSYEEGTEVLYIVNAVADNTELKVVVTKTGDDLETSSVLFNNAITTLGGGITVSGGAVIIGDVFSNGILTVSADIDGDVYSEDDIIMNWGGSITGDAYTKGDIIQPNYAGDLIAGDNNAEAENQDPSALTQDEIDTILDDTLNTTDFTPVAAGPVTRPGNWVLKYWPIPDSIYPNAEHISGNMTINTGTSITFSNSVHVDGNLRISSSDCTITFNGPVVTEGDITLQNGNIIFNDSVYAGGDLSLGGSATAEFNDDVNVVGDLDLGSDGDVSFGGTIYVGGDFQSSGDREINISGDVYIGGDLDLNGSSRIIGGQTIVVMGDVSIVGATKLDNVDEIPFLLIPTGDFEITGSGYASAMVYAPEADVSITGDAKLYGSIISNTLSLSGSAKIEYPDGLADNPNIPGGGSGDSPTDSSFNVLSWIID